MNRKNVVYVRVRVFVEVLFAVTVDKGFQY